MSASTSSSRPAPLRRFVGVAPRGVGAVLADVAVGVEDVVDDLEQEPELLRERPPRRLLLLRQLAAQSAIVTDA